MLLTDDLDLGSYESAAEFLHRALILFEILILNAFLADGYPALVEDAHACFA